MPIDAFGYNNAVSQLNNISQENLNTHEGIQDWNNKIQNEYNNAKGSEGLTDDASYVKDLMGNVMGATGINSAYKNRKVTLIDDAKARLKSITPDEVATPKPPSVLNNYEPVMSGSGGTDLTDLYNTRSTDASGASVNRGEPRPALRNGGTASEVTDLNDTIGTDERASAKGGATVMGTALSKLTGGALGEDAAETVGKYGGAFTNASIGAVDLFDGLDNIGKGKSFYKKGTSGVDEFAKDTQMVAGVSDVVGLIPGLEWVAGLGNIAGLAGSVAGMFGDHTKNVQHDANVTNMLGQIKNQPAGTSNIGEVANVSSSTIRSQ